MDAITQQLMQQLTGSAMTKIGKQIGTDKNTAAEALSTAMPLIMSALANNASKPDGAQALHQALNQDHDGSILNNVPGYLRNPQAANGAGILKHVLGTQQPTVAQGLAKGTGLSSEQIAQLLQIAAPLIMGALGKQQQQQGFDPNGLSSYLGNQRQAVQQSNPNLMGVVNNLLDFNQDGSAIDDIIGVVGSLLKKK
jgi:hypothetical protein